MLASNGCVQCWLIKGQRQNAVVTIEDLLLLIKKGLVVKWLLVSNKLICNE